MAKLTPTQQKHKEKADILVKEAAQAIEKTTTGRSPKAANLIKKANQELDKAGLIKGGLVNQK